MKILLLGKNGQLGWELQRSLALLGDVVALGRDDVGGDLGQPEALAAQVRTLAPQVIVNAAAYTAVDKAESEPELARVVNAQAPGVLAREAQALGAWLIHFSTDYVFDGGGVRPWKETDATGPLNEYGRTKLEGEMLVRSQASRHLIFRTSWVYGARGNNFASTMMRLARERDELRVIDDQIGAPTGADLLADVTAHALRSAMVRPELAGTYHVAASGETNWYEYARFVLRQAPASAGPFRVDADAVQAIPGLAYATAARRPSNSRLDTTRLRDAFGLILPPWQQGVARLLAEMN
ncbi:dTDP-4-dehydrorhamnose reductase [Variovorax sp. VNK109]|uniref:dTDP-4-dehydrorhamnose reductase n=1 Tax=Variovorax sp. VNK109 TaxID=3400919 RepID=UPI003C0F8D56